MITKLHLPLSLDRPPGEDIPACRLLASDSMSIISVANSRALNLRKGMTNTMVPNGTQLVNLPETKLMKAAT